MSELELRQDVNYKLLLERIATKDIHVTNEEIKLIRREHSEEFKNTVQLHIEQIELGKYGSRVKSVRLVKQWL